MVGRDYLKEIKANLEANRNQHRMGENVLRAFGYVRRRATAMEEINATLEELGLVTIPPMDSEMPLRSPRIRFRLKPSGEEVKSKAICELEALDCNDDDPQLEDEDDDSNLPEPGFSISELASAKAEVKRVSPNDSIEKAYTRMLLGKFSQLVVADGDTPRQQEIKGIVSFQSMAKALMNGDPTTVADCMDTNVPVAQYDDGLTSVISQLRESDVVLVIGRDKRLQGIVTAWDLAEEFTGLVGPFKRIDEIEKRLRTLVRKRLGKEKVAQFLRDQENSVKDPSEALEQLTMGGLQRVLENQGHWDELKLPLDRVEFINAFDEARDFRNRLMHFRDPLKQDELRKLTNFCEMVREIQL